MGLHERAVTSSQDGVDRRSIFGPFKVEVDFTNRQIIRVVCASMAYAAFATFLLGVFYTYVLKPAPILEYNSPPSLFSFPSDFANQRSGSGELRTANPSAVRAPSRCFRLPTQHRPTATPGRTAWATPRQGRGPRALRGSAFG